MITIALGLIIIVLAVYSLRHPWVGILGWTWISLMNPHTYSWRLASMPVAATVAGAVLIGLFVTKDKRNFSIAREGVVLILFMLWMCMVLPFSYQFDDSYLLWVRIMKIDLMILVALVLLHSKAHIIALAWVLVGSIGFYGVKGGLFTLATGGTHHVWGPEGTYIGGNNEVALALVMIIPIMRFLQLTTDNARVKKGLVVAMLLCAVAALGSQSRGALLAIAAMTTVLWWRSQSRIKTGLAFILLATLMFGFMPDTWSDRMSTIQTYDEDDSAMQRINAWKMAWNIAKNNPFGAGFLVSTPEICALYSPIPTDCRAAHSIYFMVLGEQGFIGLLLFITLWFLVWRSARHLRIEGAKRVETAWLAPLGAMVQVSLAGYAVGGAFLSLSYYDLPYNLLVLVVLGRRWLASKAYVEEAQQASEKRVRRPNSSSSLVS